MQATNTKHTVINTEFMQQQQTKGLITGKSYNTVCPSVVGKWFVMIELNCGMIGCGIDENKEQATINAINEALANK